MTERSATGTWTEACSDEFWRDFDHILPRCNNIDLCVVISIRRDRSRANYSLEWCDADVLEWKTLSVSALPVEIAERIVGLVPYSR